MGMKVSLGSAVAQGHSGSLQVLEDWFLSIHSTSSLFLVG